MSSVPLHLRLAYETCYSNPYADKRPAHHQPLRTPATYPNRCLPVSTATGGNFDGQHDRGWFSSVLAAVTVEQSKRGQHATNRKALPSVVKQAPMNGARTEAASSFSSSPAAAVAASSSSTDQTPRKNKETTSTSSQQPLPVADDPPAMSVPSSSVVVAPHAPTAQNADPHVALEREHSSTRGAASTASSLSDWNMQRRPPPSPPLAEREPVQGRAEIPTAAQESAVTTVQPLQQALARRNIEIVYDLPPEHPQATQHRTNDKDDGEAHTEVTQRIGTDEGTEGLAPVDKRDLPVEAASNTEPQQVPEDACATGAGAPAKQSSLYDVYVKEAEGSGDPHLVASIVDALYAKLEASAVKVVALDDMNQQLIENFPQVRSVQQTAGDNEPKMDRGNHKAAPRILSPSEKEELALHLYTLREQVKTMQRLLDERDRRQQRELAKLTAQAGAASSRAAPHRAVTVEVVRAFEEEPVPYKKPPFRKAQRNSSADAAESATITTTTSTSEWRAARNAAAGARDRTQASSSSSQSKKKAKVKAKATFALASHVKRSDSESIVEDYQDDGYDEELPTFGYSTIRATSALRSLSATTTSNNSSSSKASTTSLQSVDRTKVKAQSQAASSSSSSASSSQHNAQTSDSSHSSTGELFWKRRAAAAAAARQRREAAEAAPRGPRSSSSSFSSSLSRSSSSSRSTTTTTTTSSSSSLTTSSGSLAD